MNDPSSITLSRVPQVGQARRLLRWWQLARYHQPRQLRLRAWKVLKGKLPAVVTASGALKEALPLRQTQHFAPLIGFWLAECSTADRDRRADELLRGDYRFLNQARHLGQPPQWRAAEVPRLWGFHLHYHEFLLDLWAAHIAGRQSAGQLIWDIIYDWMRHHPAPAYGCDAWHPYCISRRLPVWCALWHGAPPETNHQPLLHSLARQADYLARNLEHDLGGNHLLENVRALLFAGAFFTGPHAERWLDRAGATLKQQCAQQLLPSGEHFERSPMYHAIMLRAFLDMRDVLLPLRPQLAETCAQAATNMARFLKDILHPDGRIPLFSDAVFDETPHTEILMARAGVAPDPPSPRGAKMVGDYWVADGAPGARLVFDCGPVGPDHLPAHAHCDLSNFELSVGARRVITDSGTHDYEDGAMRHYCRSTQAHNAVEVDGHNQCDIWSRFRMGARGWPIRRGEGKTLDTHWAWMVHNAYRTRGVPRVGRWMAARGDHWMCVDWAAGKGIHQLVGRLHFHPDASLRQSGERHFVIVAGEQPLSLVFSPDATVELTQGWYCPEFGVRAERQVLTYTVRAPLPAVMSWVLTTTAQPDLPLVRSTHDAQITIHWSEGSTAASACAG